MDKKGYYIGLNNFVRMKLFKRDYYVTADPRDNSVTLSRDLLRRLRLGSQDSCKVMVVRLNAGGEYAFVVNPPVGTETPLADMQYNARENCVGFECLVPTVNRIMYDYGLGHDEAVRLTVRESVTDGGVVYYRMCRP